MATGGGEYGGSNRRSGFTPGVYTTYFGGVKKLLTEFFSHLVIPEGMYHIFISRRLHIVQMIFDLVVL